MNILIADRFPLAAELELKGLLGSKTNVSRLEDGRYKEQLEAADVLIVRSKFPVTADVLKDAKNLKFAVTVTSGFDHIDLKICKERGILVSHIPEANAASAAELTFLLAISCARKLRQGDTAVRKGKWDRESLMGSELSGKTWGIVGLGRIGRRVATIAKALGLEVQAFDPYIEDEVFTHHGVERLSLTEIYRSSDIISLHVPLTKESFHMVNIRSLENFQRDAILINTSRGSVVHEKDLVTALQKQWLGGVGLDVFEHEPLATTAELLDFPNAVLTPHVGANTNEAFERGSRLAVQRVKEFVETGRVTSGSPWTEPWFRS